MSAAAPLLIPDFARHWARELDCKESSLVRLKGGINNRVYRCGEHDRHQWVIKGYAPLEPGARDRMQAEMQFLQYAAQVAPAFTPGLIHVDADQRCLVLEYLEGETFPEGVPPPQEAVITAVRFFRLLNNSHNIARNFIQMDAAESFLSVRQHLVNIEKRLNKMQYDHLEGSLKVEAKALLGSVRSSFESVHDTACKQIASGEVVDLITSEACCVSPSDFGFHNAIMTYNGLKFIDFEFSGWDDPAKALLDFVLQPRVPVKTNFSQLLQDVHTSKYGDIAGRCAILAPILHLKWICIVLAVLIPNRLQQILRVIPEVDQFNFINSRLRLAALYQSNAGLFCENIAFKES